MITAIIRNKSNTLVLELPHSIYDIYEKLQSIGIMQPPKQIPLTDNEDEDIGVKLFSDNDFGNHLLLTLSEDNSLADANLLTYIVQNASEDIKETLEQDVLYDQYGSMNEVVAAVHQMTQDAGPVKAVVTPDKKTIRQQGRWIKEPNEPMFTLTVQDRHGILRYGRVRKLTPRECWRLQGFTDEQFDKAKAAGLSDGRLYKMAGNAVYLIMVVMRRTDVKTAPGEDSWRSCFT